MTRPLVLLTLLGVFSACGSSEEPTTAGLNVVFFLVDDLGWTDVGAFGSTFYETPNVNRLAGWCRAWTRALGA